MKQFRFLDWKVYKDAIELFLTIKSSTDGFVFGDKKNIGDQAVRSALSVVLNIAEGSGKHSNKEFIRFVDIALGSLYETRAAVDIFLKTNKISESESENLERCMVEIANQLGGLRKHSKNKL